MSTTIQRTYEARKDLESIAQYTLDVWGAAQLRTYMAGLDETIHTLAGQPETQGQDRSQYKPGLRSIPHKDHYFIFYRVKGRNVELLRVLHQHRNWQRIMLER